MDESGITGIIAVKAAVMAGNRAVKTVLLDTEKRSDPGFSAFARRAGEMGHGVEWLPSQALQERAGEGCQGAAALVGPRRMKPLAELLTLPQLVLLHGVEDPYNFCDALRSLYAAGVDGVILPPLELVYRRLRGGPGLRRGCGMDSHGPGGSLRGVPRPRPGATASSARIRTSRPFPYSRRTCSRRCCWRWGAKSGA